MRIGPETRVVLTGASRGIGRATARALADRGAKVGLIARPSDDLTTLAGELDGAEALPADVAEREQVDGAVSGFAEAHGGLDVAIANAGIAHYAPFTDLDPERAERMVQVNVIGTLNLVRSALPHLTRAGEGHLVIVSSGAGLRAFPWAATYGATKAAQRAFAEALRHELDGTGVSVTTVYPGEVKTALHDHERDRMPDWYGSEGAIPATDVAERIAGAIERDRREVHVPGKVRLLGLNGLAPGLVDRLLARIRGRSAAPRRH